MAYSKTTWVTGDTVTATKLNHAEDGIATAQSTADGAAESVEALGAPGAIDTENLADGAVTLAKLADAVKSHYALADDVDKIKNAVGLISESGKNVLPIEKYEKTIRGLDVTYENGTLKRNGTATLSMGDRVSGDFVLPAGTYTFWSDNRLFNVLYIKKSSDASTLSIVNDSNIRTFTVATDTTVYLYCTVTSGRTFDNALAYIQLESGSTSTTWETPILTAVDLIAREAVQDTSELVNNTTYRKYIPFELGNKGTGTTQTNRMSLSQNISVPNGTKFASKTGWLFAIYTIGSIVTSGWVTEYTFASDLEVAMVVLKKSDDSDLTNVYKIVTVEDCLDVSDKSLFYLKGKYILSPNVIYGKHNYAKYCSIGDSITYGYWYNGTTMVKTDETYAKIIFDNMDIDEYVNNSVSSTSISTKSDYSDNTNAFVNRISNIPTDSDLITILGGTNDFGHNTPLGTIADVTDISFYGAVSVLLTGIINRCPNARVIFITPLHRSNDTVANSVGKTLADYVNAIKEVCSLFGVQVIDGYAESGFNTLSSIITNFMPDGLHPNPDGHAMLARNIIHNF